MARGLLSSDGPGSRPRSDHSGSETRANPGVCQRSAPCMPDGLGPGGKVPESTTNGALQWLNNIICRIRRGTLGTSGLCHYSGRRLMWRQCVLNFCDGDRRRAQASSTTRSHRVGSATRAGERREEAKISYSSSRSPWKMIAMGRPRKVSRARNGVLRKMVDGAVPPVLVWRCECAASPRLVREKREGRVPIRSSLRVVVCSSPASAVSAGQSPAGPTDKGQRPGSGTTASVRDFAWGDRLSEGRAMCRYLLL